MVTIRLATKDDVNAIISFDRVAQIHPERVDYINRVVNAGECYVGSTDSQIIAYGVLNYYFYEQGMIDMIYIHPDFRRKGIGTQFLSFFEQNCETDKLFTSTNESNKPMQKLLEKAGYQKSGIIYNLDENDPEIVYFKRVTSIKS